MTRIENDTPISELTVEQLRSLVRQTIRDCMDGPRFARGLQGLADTLGVSLSTAKRIKASGVLRGAISQMGGVILVNVPLARAEWVSHCHKTNISKLN